MIETLLSTLAVGTVWFWLIVVLSSIIITTCVENEHYPTPSVVTILFGVIYWKTIASLPWSVIGIFIGVFALVGGLWAVFQWYRRVGKVSANYESEYGSTLTKTQMASLKADVSVLAHKALITGWIAFWPWDLLWTLTGDFFNTIYDSLAGVFQKISYRAISKFAVAKPEPKD